MLEVALGSLQFGSSIREIVTEALAEEIVKGEIVEKIARNREATSNRLVERFILEILDFLKFDE